MLEGIGSAKGREEAGGEGVSLPLIDDAVLVEVQLLEDPVGHIHELLGEVELPHHLPDIGSLLQNARARRAIVFSYPAARCFYYPHNSMGQPEEGSIVTALERPRCASNKASVLRMQNNICDEVLDIADLHRPFNYLKHT